MAEGDESGGGGYSEEGRGGAQPERSSGSRLNMDTRYPRSIEGILRIATVVGWVFTAGWVGGWS